MLNPTKNFSTAARVLLVLAACIIVVAGMRSAAAILVPFLLSIFIAIICTPPLSWLQNKGLHPLAAIFVVIASIVIMGTLTGALIGNSIQDFSTQLPLYQARLESEFSGLLQWLKQQGVDIFDQQIMEYFDPGAAMRLVVSMLSSFSGVLTNTFLILLTVIFILLEAASFPGKLRKIANDVTYSLTGFDSIINNIKRYMAIKTIISLLTAAFVTIALLIIGVDYALLWGLLTFILNFIPNIGSIIAAVPPILLAFVQLGFWPAVATLTVELLANIIFGNIIEPRYMGKDLGLSTLIVFLSLVFWGWALGPVGMLLSVPLTMTVKIALESSPDTHWLAVILGPAVHDKTT